MTHQTYRDSTIINAVKSVLDDEKWHTASEISGGTKYTPKEIAYRLGLMDVEVVTDDSNNHPNLYRKKRKQVNPLRKRYTVCNPDYEERCRFRRMRDRVCLFNDKCSQQRGSNVLYVSVHNKEKK